MQLLPSLRIALLVICMALGLTPTHATEARDVAADPALEARMLAIAAELRCLVCQNQTVADSHAALAVDLRDEIRKMLARGDSDAQVIDFMTQRYGDFVLYRPPVRATTWALWFGPVLLLLGASLALVLHLRRRAQRPATDFDPDEESP
jgi:cytochrome c-type biogenesis protein CcmH